MRREATRASLVVVLLLVSVAATSAESVWVLWVNVDLMRPSTRYHVAFDWHMAEAFTNQPDCIAAMRKKFLETVGETTPNTGHLDADSFHILTSGGEAAFNGRCLLDGIDPSGPKAK